MNNSHKFFRNFFAVVLATVCIMTGTATAQADEIRIDSSTRKGQTIETNITDTDSDEKSTDIKSDNTDSDKKSTDIKSDNTDNDEKSTDVRSDDTDSDEKPIQIQLGDVNHDGIINSVDALLTLRQSVGFNDIEEEYLKYADYDGDGKITSSDSLFILRKSVGLDNTLDDTLKRKNVIDVSEHQGSIDWEKVKGKIDGAILRCGYGGDMTFQDDKQYIRNLAECERLGIPKGVYLYSYAKTEKQAQSELAHILRLIKGHNFELPIFIDCEEPGTESFAPTACKIICEGLKDAGYTPGVYASLSWWNSYLTNVTEYVRWVAQWSSSCTYQGIYYIWQYSESGRVNGIVTAVDMNYLYDNIE